MVKIFLEQSVQVSMETIDHTNASKNLMFNLNWDMQLKTSSNHTEDLTL